MRTARALWIVPLALCLVVLTAAADDVAKPAEIVRVMSFNLWVGGDGGRQPLEKTAAVIRAAKADLVGLQETRGLAAGGGERPDRAAELARLLGWNYLDQGGGTGVISRFKIVGHTRRKWGVKIELPSRRIAYHFNAHFAPAPYQPYQLLRIPYKNAPFLRTAEQAVAAATEARGEQVERLLREVSDAGDAIMFLTGDFNEPSHLDWTAAAARARKCPLAVAWPATGAVTRAGFVDAYRAVHADPLKHPGHTWTPTTSPDDPKDRHDRIDFVFVRGKGVRVRAAAVVGEAKAFADVVVTPYPSDHRAVVAEVSVDRAP